MENALAALEQVFLTYREELDKSAKGHKVTDGLFGFGHSIKDDACHEQFDEAVKQTLMQLVESGISPDDAEACARLIYTQMDLYAYPQSAQWMLYAAERHIPILIPALSPQGAARLCAEYGKRYRPWNRLPAQRDVYKVLKAHANTAK